MTLKTIAIDDLEEHHLADLVERGVPEIRYIDYKRELPRPGESASKDFLADVCSFANSGGGDLVYGVEEEGGVPKAVTGIPMPDPDREILRLENLIRDGIDPRPTGFASRAIPLADGKHVLVIRVPRSFNRPHAVDYGNRFRYYSRNSAGKYPMNVGEVRDAVLASETVAERLRAFRNGRLADLAEGETPVDFSGVATVVLHVMPLAGFDVPALSVDLAAARRSPKGFLPIGTGGNYTYNFDGLLIHSATRVYGDAATRLPESYALLFRSGVVEAADSQILWPEADGPIIPSVLFEGELLAAVHMYLAMISYLGIEGPVYIALSLLGVGGYEMAAGRRRYSGVHPVDRDALVVPEVMAVDPGLDRDAVEHLMRPVFDHVWNACGYAGSPYYDERDRWDGDRR